MVLYTVYMPGSFTSAIRSLFAFRPRRQLRELYVFLLLFSFATALVTIFEPIFFYTQGIPIWKICVYYALHYTLYFFLMPLGAQFSARFGYERSLALSTPLFVLYFLLLAGLDGHISIFYLALVVLTCFKILYWPAYHATFITFTDGRNGGTEQSWVRFVEYGAGVLGPVLGGLVAEVYGFSVLFLASAATVALAGITLLKTKERYRAHEFEYTSPWRLIVSRRHRNMVVSMIGWGENFVYLALWPVWLIIIFRDVELVGVIASMSAVAATVLGFVIGELTDRFTAKRMVKFAVPLAVGSYVWRFFGVLPWHIVVGDVMARMSYVGVGIPFLARLYKQGRREDPLAYATAAEMVLALVKALLAAILAVVFLFFPVSMGFNVAFAAAAILTLFYLAL